MDHKLQMAWKFHPHFLGGRGAIFAALRNILEKKSQIELGQHKETCSTKIPQ